ncbi:DUF2130 domain-containing protein [Planctomicrobium sp. SH664]|uniref:DUF2130 domain-containing protein n=1 Tax=Planctomicrobium sp. SH664 TaxID=3448125 RepID=UPI003F5C0186
MPETIKCKNCQAEIEITEALSTQVRSELQKQFDEDLRKREKQFAERDAKIASERAELAQAQQALKTSQAALQEELQQQLAKERDRLKADAFKLAREELTGQLQEQQTELQSVKQKLQDAQKQEMDLRKQARELEEQKREFELTLTRQLDEEREKLKAESIKIAREELTVQLNDQQAELQAIRQKLQNAQQQEMDLRKQARELEEQKREFELNLTRQLDQERVKIREAALKQADEDRQLKEAEKDKIISDMKRQIDELKRKSEQGSQQLQGEVMELGLEESLRRHFPFDGINPVPKGVHGGDVLQEIHNPTGHPCGSILWESKRTKTWSDGWLPKLRDDQRAAKAQLAILVSAELPKGVTTFCCQDGVWITSSACAISVALALREGLINVAMAKQALHGHQGKMEQLYQYLSGSEFRNRVEGIVEAYTTLREDLDKEKKQTLKRWAEREKQLDRAIAQAAGMYGDVQGIAGPSVLSIPSLSPPLLEDDSAEDEPDRKTLFKLK